MRFAVDDAGQVIDALAGRPQASHLLCMGCREPVHFRKESEVVQRRAHFSHGPNTACLLAANKGGWTGYTSDHVHAIAQAFIVTNALNVRFICPHCPGTCHHDGLAIAEARQEVPVAGRRADIMLYPAEADPIAIEVFHTHKMEDEKVRDFEEVGLTFYEVRAKDFKCALDKGSFDIPACRTNACPKINDQERTIASHREAVQDRFKVARIKMDATQARIQRHVDDIERIEKEMNRLSDKVIEVKKTVEKKVQRIKACAEHIATPYELVVMVEYVDKSHGAPLQCAVRADIFDNAMNDQWEEVRRYVSLWPMEEK